MSVGIPTYNRVFTLERALRSVLEQTHSELEVVISDNCSDDDTELLCRALAAEDGRIRYIRQPRNIGPTANFNVLFDALRSSYAMVLADDDWLDREYVERCLSVLQRQPGCVAVSGRGLYWQGERRLKRQGLILDLLQSEGARRVHCYYQLIGSGRGETSTFFGVMPVEVLRRATPMPNVLGNDMLVTARIVFQGTVCTLDDVHINRSLGGTSVSTASIVSTLELPSRQASWPSFVIAGQVLSDIGWGSEVYGRLSPARRLIWAVRSAVAAIYWKSVGWHATVPIAASLARRPRGRWLWSAYDRLVRALVARQSGEPGL